MESLESILLELEQIFKKVPKKDLQIYSENLFQRVLDYKEHVSKGKLKYNLEKVASFLFLIRIINDIIDKSHNSESTDFIKEIDDMVISCLNNLANDKNLIQNLSNFLIENQIVNKSGFNISIDIQNLAKTFQSLIPPKIRKYIAAYYTKRESASLLAALSIMSAMNTKSPINRIADFSCGGGILLQESLEILLNLKDTLNEPKKKIEVFGNDIVEHAIQVSKISLYPKEKEFEVELTLVDGISITPQTPIPLKSGNNVGKYDLVIENPPFTRTERISSDHNETSIQAFITSNSLEKYYSKRMGLQSIFLFHADTMLNPSGTLAFVLPANIFNIDTKSLIENFFFDNKYHIKYVVGLSSNSYSFSEDCAYKEILLVAQKGTLDKNKITKFIQLSEIPDPIHAKKLAEMVNSSDQGEFKIESTNIQINPVPTLELLTSRIKWDTYFWSLPQDTTEALQLSKCPNLIPLSDSTEFSARTGFHSTYSNLLIVPNKYFTIQQTGPPDLENLTLIRQFDKKIIKIPMKYFSKCFREPKLYQKFYEKSEHYVYIHSEDIDPTIFKDFIGHLTECLKEIYESKEAGGIRKRDELDKKWFMHPKQTGALQKESTLFTFNRYGIWKRSNLCVLANEPITANDGFHLYAYEANEDLSPNLDESTALKLLCSWFNSSIHIMDFLSKCRVPAKHVQQVSLSDRQKMFVPIMNNINPSIWTKILEATDKLNDILPLSLLEQFNRVERKELDKLWIEALEIPLAGKNYEAILKNLYPQLIGLINNR